MHVCCAAPLEFWVTVGGVILVLVIILTGLCCGLFFFLLRPNTNQRGTRAADESPDHAELGRLASSRRIAVRRST